MLIVAIWGIVNVGLNDDRERIDALLALRTSNPAAFLASGSSVSEADLQAIKAKSSAAYDELMARRDPDWAAKTRAKNAPQIAQLEAELNDIPDGAVDYNNDRYQKLVALDPAKAKYQERAAYFKAEADKLEYLRAHPEEALQVVKSSWYKAGFDNVAIVTLTIRNTAGWEIRDPVVTCRFFGNSHTMVGSITRTIYEPIKANSTKTIRDYNMGLIDGQASASANCEITAANE